MYDGGGGKEGGMVFPSVNRAYLVPGMTAAN